MNALSVVLELPGTLLVNMSADEAVLIRVSVRFQVTDTTVEDSPFSFVWDSGKLNIISFIHVVKGRAPERNPCA